MLDSSQLGRIFKQECYTTSTFGNTPSATPDDGPTQAGGGGGGPRCVPAEAGGVVRLSPPPQPARLLNQPACSISPPVLLLGFAAGCVG